MFIIMISCGHPLDMINKLSRNSHDFVKFFEVHKNSYPQNCTFEDTHKTLIKGQRDVIRKLSANFSRSINVIL